MLLDYSQTLVGRSPENINTVSGLLAEARESINNIHNEQIADDAEIDYSKLALAGEIKGSDIKAGAAIAIDKLAKGGAAQVPIAAADGTLTYRTVTGAVAVSATGATTLAAPATLNVAPPASADIQLLAEDEWYDIITATPSAGFWELRGELAIDVADVVDDYPVRVSARILYNGVQVSTVKREDITGGGTGLHTLSLEPKADQACDGDGVIKVQAYCDTVIVATAKGANSRLRGVRWRTS